jgi:hypothetical protein
MEKRPGGRRKGRPNRSTIYIRDLIDETSDLLTTEGRDGLQHIIEALFHRAIGIPAVGRRRRGQGVVYKVLPDIQAARLILEHRFGKPKESIEITDPDEKFHGLPQLILVPPNNWDGGKRYDHTPQN